MSSRTVMWLMALLIILTLAVTVLALTSVQRARSDRLRSDARVAALAAAIDDPRWDASLVDEFRPEQEPEPPAMSLVVPDVEQPSRIPAFVGAALVVLSAVAFVLVGWSGGKSQGTAAAPALELVSMRHAIDGETLIVTGLVRNPSGSVTPALSAVISVLGRDGQLVARGQSRLDPVMLGPGKETTFRVAVSEVGNEPGRYRIAFVNGSQVVPHVDRRIDVVQAALATAARRN